MSRKERTHEGISQHRYPTAKLYEAHGPNQTRRNRLLSCLAVAFFCFFAWLSYERFTYDDFYYRSYLRELETGLVPVPDKTISHYAYYDSEWNRPQDIYYWNKPDCGVLWESVRDSFTPHCDTLWQQSRASHSQECECIGIDCEWFSRDCESSIFPGMTDTLVYNFNFTKESKEWRITESIPLATASGVHGKIRVERGHIYQSSDIEVHADIRSTLDDNDYHIVVTDSSFSIGGHGTDNIPRSCTDMDIKVYLRPFLNHTVDLFGVWSRSFDISFGYYIDWEINNLTAHSNHGDIHLGVRSRFLDISFEYYTGWEINNLTAHSDHGDIRLRHPHLIAHNVSLSTINGNIFGWWTLLGNINLSSRDGDVGVHFVAGREPHKKLTLESLSVHTMSGNIDIVASIGALLSKASAHDIDISSRSGDIAVQLPHGDHTSIKTDTGTMIALLVPYYKNRNDAAKNDIVTWSVNGSAAVSVSMASWMVANGTTIYNPLWGIEIGHNVTDEDLRLAFPDEWPWIGRVEALVVLPESLPLDMDRRYLDRIRYLIRDVKATRAVGAETRIMAWVEEGSLELKMGRTSA